MGLVGISGWGCTKGEHIATQKSGRDGASQCLISGGSGGGKMRRGGGEGGQGASGRKGMELRALTAGKWGSRGMSD